MRFIITQYTQLDQCEISETEFLYSNCISMWYTYGLRMIISENIDIKLKQTDANSFPGVDCVCR